MAIEKKVFRNGPYADLFCQGVRVGDTLYMAGQVGTDENGAAPELELDISGDGGFPEVALTDLLYVRLAPNHCIDNGYGD